MLVADRLMQTQTHFKNGLRLLDQFIWPAVQAIDSDTKAFYVFKPYPKQLKRMQIEPWAQLQCKALSPFINGEHYKYLSKAGLHLWISQTGFHGLPETALQATLGNGSHIVTGTKYHYQQTWSDGLLVDCQTLEKSVQQSDAVTPLLLNQKFPWAVNRKIDSQLKTPSTWLGIILFVFLCGVIWHAAGFLTLSLQSHYAEQTTNALQEKLGEQLARQERLQSQQRSLANLQIWQSEFGYLPETFAAIVEKISQQVTWQANSITWQNRTLVLELVAKELDIATLVAALEQVNSLDRVNIRPHISDDTWILEATLK